MAKHLIILRNGQTTPIESWRKTKGLTGSQVSKNFSLNGDPELKDRDGGFCMSEIAIEVLQRLRDKRGKPTRVNSGCRTDAEQRDLIKGGSKAATTSPHVQGMAVDVDTVSHAESDEVTRMLKEIADEMGILIRIGVMTYKKPTRTYPTGMTFVHYDVCPEYYSPVKPYYTKAHPWQWEREMTW